MKIAPLILASIAAATSAAADITVVPLPAGARLTDDPGGTEGCSISADGRTWLVNMSTIAGEYPVVWDLGTEPILLRPPGAWTGGHASTGGLSADGNRAIFTAWGDGLPAAYLWDRASGYTALGAGMGDGTGAMAISRNGAYMAGVTWYYQGFSQQLPVGRGDPGPASIWPSSPGNFWPQWISDDGQHIAGRLEPDSGYALFWGNANGSHIVRLNMLGWTFAPDGTAAGESAGGNAYPYHALVADAQTWRGLPGTSNGPSAVSVAISATSGQRAVLGVTATPGGGPYWYWSATTGSYRSAA